MAQTWPVSKRRIAALKIVDMVGRAVSRPFRRRAVPRRIDRMLVIEPWNLGDVVLVTPVLARLRKSFPSAKITLLAREYARDLLKGSGLVDDVIVADLPWTAPTHKYRVTRRVARSMRGLVRDIRRRRFDVTLDARMDIRSNTLAALSGAPMRVGYSIGGGGWLLTDTLPSGRNHSHRIDDWLALVRLLDQSDDGFEIERSGPTLIVSDDEKTKARKRITETAGAGTPTIGYHPGGSHPGKRWPRERFNELIASLRAAVGGRHVVFLGPNEEGGEEFPPGVTVLRPSLREYMGLVTCCDVLVCNDSGPMHVADALGVPVVTIFEMGNPQWFGPSGPRARVLSGELAGIGMSAAPLDRPPANPVSVARVAAAVKETLESGRLARCPAE